MLSVVSRPIMLSVIMPSIVRLYVVMLSVVAPRPHLELKTRPKFCPLSLSLPLLVSYFCKLFLKLTPELCLLKYFRFREGAATGVFQHNSSQMANGKGVGKNFLYKTRMFPFSEKK